jgi:flavorubredoxin
VTAIDRPPAAAHTREPVALTADTLLLTQHLAGAVPLPPLPVSSLVVAGAQPVIVDTGTALGGPERIARIAALVPLESVRWIFLSHEDADHAGNVRALLEQCPRATLVTSWLTVRRLAASFRVPAERCRWINDGESFDAGDRVLTAITPPLYDAPSTRGLFDRRTGVYWAADAFGTTAAPWRDDAADIDADDWKKGTVAFHGLLAPWHELVDPRRFAARVQHLRRLSPTVLASAHGPVIRGDRVGDALDLLLELPGRDPARLPGQAELEAQIRH